MSSGDLDRVFRLKDEKDWVLWKFQISILLKFQEVYDYVTGEEKKPTNESESDYRTKLEKYNKSDIKAQRAISSTIEKDALLHIVNCKTAAEMWAKLKSVYEQKSETSVHYLQQKFFTFEKDPADSIATFVSKLQELVQQLCDLGEQVSDKMLITKILLSLPPSLNYFKSAWESTADDKKTLNELCARLMMEENRASEASGSTSDGALLAKYRKIDGKSADFEDSRRSVQRCYICGSTEHYKRDCKFNKRKKEYKKKSDALCCTFVAAGNCDDWYMDSGATEHMSCRREWFRNFETLNVPHPVRIGNGEIINAVGRGDIDVLVYDGRAWQQRYLAGVLYVPKMVVNLFSQGRCLDKGCVMSAMSGECEFKRDGETVAVGVRETGLYKMLIRAAQTQSNANVAMKEGIRLWHERLAHQNVAHVKRFLAHNEIKYVDEANFQCEACIYGKQHRLPFRHRTERSSVCGDVIHTDVCGPFQTRSLGGSRYYLLLKDDFSHYRFVYFLREKSEVAEKVKSFINFVGTQTSYKIKVLRMDGGGEFVNKNLGTFFNERGIKSVCTVPYTPEQNGAVERENRTVVEAARSMLYSMDDAKEKLFLWAEAVNTAVHVLNRSGASSVDNKTPYELWFGKRATVDNFKVFGSVVFAHIPKQKRRKLDKKATKCIFVGYTDHTNSYRVYNSENRSIQTARDVIFEKRAQSETATTKQDKNNKQSECVDVFSFENDSLEKGSVNEQNEQIQNENNDDDFVVGENNVSVESVISVSSESSADQSVGNATGNDSMQTNDGNNQNDANASGGNVNGQADGNVSVNSLTDRITDFVGRISGSRICNVDARNVVNERLRSQVSEIDIAECLFSSNGEPDTYSEAIESHDKNSWCKAMDEEYASLMKNGTWKLVDAPRNQKIIDNKWVYKMKLKPDGSIDRYKARLVVRGFTQRYGVNYKETFSPVVRYSSIRAILAVSAARKMTLKQFDVKTAFLYGDLAEDIYMKQPIGYDDGSGKVCKLLRSLYGLKQASRCWNEKFTTFIKQFDFVVSEADPCVFICKRSGELTILAIYVDDGLISSTNARFIERLLKYLKRIFEITVSNADFYLGFEIHRRSDGSIHINQSAYIRKILNRFGLADANAVATPVDNQQHLGVVENQQPVKFPYREAVGCLMFLAIGTRPDIAFGVSLASRFLDSAAEIHVTAVKRILKYLKGTQDYGIFYDSNPNEFKFFAYSDADYAGDLVKRKSTSGNCFLLGSSVISWASELQRCTAQSTAEAEYVAASEATKELVWLKRLVNGLDDTLSKEKPSFYLDNHAAIKLTKNPEFHKRSKHIDTRYHYIREKYELGAFELKSVSTENQLADIFTKALPKNRFEFLRNHLNIVSMK